MAVRARLVLLAAVTAFAAACGGTSAPTPAPAGASATPAPSLPVQQPTDPCGVAVTHLGALTARMADGLALLRKLVIAASFNGVETAAAIRRVSATLTTYVGLEQTLEGCDATAALAPRVDELRTRAEATLAGSLSARITDDKVHWDGAVGLLGLLPEVLSLSGDAKSVADGLGIDVAVATDPGAAAAGRSPPPGPSWPELAAWDKGFWPLVTGHVGKIRAATQQRKPAVVDAEAAKLAAVVATGRKWLAGSQAWPCYQSFRKLTDDAVATYRDAAAAYASNKDASGAFLLKKADGMLAKLNAKPLDRFEVRCMLDPAAPG